MAAAYLFHIAQNPPFHDGNKRVAAMSALVFLDVNGIANLPGQEDLERATLEVASIKMSKSELTDWFRNRIGDKP
jgi:death-on-curing protein